MSAFETGPLTTWVWPAQNREDLAARFAVALVTADGRPWSWPCDDDARMKAAARVVRDAFILADAFLNGGKS